MTRPQPTIGGRWTMKMHSGIGRSWQAGVMSVIGRAIVYVVATLLFAWLARRVLGAYRVPRGRRSSPAAE